jgi:hypothetical protein
LFKSAQFRVRTVPQQAYKEELASQRPDESKAAQEVPEAFLVVKPADLGVSFICDNFAGSFAVRFAWMRMALISGQLVSW